MANIINTLNIIVIALANIPMTLESGITFHIGNWSPAEATRIFMENSPFFISMTSNGGIQLTNSKGQWITRTFPIVEAKTFDNGYCYFVTKSGHKYQFTLHSTADHKEYLKTRDKVYTPLSLEESIFSAISQTGHCSFNSEDRCAISKACNKLKEKGRVKDRVLVNLWRENDWFNTYDEEDYHFFTENGKLSKMVKISTWFDGSGDGGEWVEEREEYLIREYSGSLVCIRI